MSSPYSLFFFPRSPRDAGEGLGAAAGGKWMCFAVVEVGGCTEKEVSES